MFIIADKPGDLKFYNGPSFSNEYSKTQFSNASGNLLGVTFNRQQIGFKVGMYYFSISDWQDFIEWINPYEVNYLTFSHAPEYGYLVKLAKIEDTPRYVVGNEDGKPMYYTEMTLTWDLQGDSCVRSNLPYEWEWKDNQFSLDGNGPMKESRLETPLLLTIPLNISEAHVEVEFKYKTNTLFKVTLQNMSTNNDNSGMLLLTPLKLKTIDVVSNTNIEISNCSVWYNNREYDRVWLLISNNVINKIKLENVPENTSIEINTTDIIYTNKLDKKLMQYFTIIFYVNDFYKQNIFLVQPTIQYDSETGVLLYNAGDTSWKLLHLNMIDDEGNYMIKNMQVNKFKLQGNISEYEFDLSITGASIPNNTQPILQIYERTNVI